jgi:hypothetical protein
METLSVEAIEKLLRCVNPVFEDLEPSQGKDEYVFRGSSFNVSFHGRLHLITAGHVVSGWPVANLRVFDLVTRNSLPFKGFHPRKSAEDTDDVASKPAKDTHLPCTRRIVRFSGIHAGALLSGQDRPSLYRD